MDNMVFTVSELIRHLVQLKRRGLISGNEEVIDMGFFGITHVNVEKGVDGNMFLMLCSVEAEQAETEMSYEKNA